MNYGDFPIEETIHVFFTTRAFATGIPGTLSAATVAVYEDITSTPIETGIAVTESLNSIAGLNAVPIVAIAASGYEVGKNYHVVIEAGTVDSVSVVGEVVAYFSIGRSAAAVDLANATDGLGAIKAETALIVADTGELQADDVPGLIATTEAVVDTVKAETALIVADTNELQADDIPGAIAALNDIAAADVWAVDATSQQTAGTFGQAIGDPGANTETMYDAVVTDAAGLNVAADVVAVKAETALIVADTNELQTDNIPGDIAALNDIAASDVWAVDATGQQTQGTFGQAIGDPGADADTIYGSVVTGAAGANIAVDLIAVKAETALIVGDTSELQTDNIPGTLSSMDGKLDAIDNFLDTEIAAITDAVITNAAGADIAADIIAVKAETAAIVTDTDVIDDATSGLVKIASDVAAVLVDTGTTLPLTLGGVVLAQGTIGATGNDTTHLHLDGLAYADDGINEHLIVLKDVSTGLFYATWISDFATASDLATVNTLPITPEASVDLYWLLPMRQDLTGGSGPSAATIADAIWDEAQADHVAVGSFGITATEIADALVDTNELQGDDVPGLIATLTAVVDTVKTETALIVADTGELQVDWANAGRLDAILDARASQVTADAIVTDLDNGTDGLGALKTLIDTVNSDLANGTDGLGALKTLLDAIPTTAMRGTDSAATATNLTLVDTVVDAIKVITDQMVFTKANELDANTQSINGAAVVGDGNATPWDGA